MLVWWCPRKEPSRGPVQGLSVQGHPWSHVVHTPFVPIVGPSFPHLQRGHMTTVTNPYLEGNYAPVHEEFTATELR